MDVDARRGVRSAFGFDRPASAYDVTEAVSTAQGRRVAANSVYRILDLFVANNVATRVESANAYLANAHPGCLHDCIFLVCDACGRAAHVDDDQLSARIRETAARDRLSPRKAGGRSARALRRLSVINTVTAQRA